MRDAKQERTGGAPVARAVSHEMQSRQCKSDGGEGGFFVCFEIMIFVAGAMNISGRCARSVRMIISAASSEKNAQPLPLID